MNPLKKGYVSHCLEKETEGILALLEELSWKGVSKFSQHDILYFCENCHETVEQAPGFWLSF